MKSLLLASVFLSLASVGCGSTDPDRDFGTRDMGDYVRVRRVPPGGGVEAGAIADLRGTVRQTADEGCVWEAFLTNRNKARAVRATVDKSTRGRSPQRYTVTIPAGQAVSLGCAHPFGGRADTYFNVDEAEYAD
jgi:hypothetical protein